MPYCPQCGVEVSNKKCPLCYYNINQDISKKPVKQEKREGKMQLSGREKMIIYEVSTWFAVIIISSLCITTDFLGDNKITWSLFPIIPVLSFGIITTISINAKGFLKVLLIFITVILMLVSLDIIIPGSHTLGISVPITIISSFLSLIIVILYRKSKTRGANIAAYIIISLAILLIAIEIIINITLSRAILPYWSIITTVTLIPIALFLLYIHFSLSKKVDLKKVFHTS